VERALVGGDHPRQTLLGLPKSSNRPQQRRSECQHEAGGRNARRLACQIAEWRSSVSLASSHSSGLNSPGGVGGGVGGGRSAIGIAALQSSGKSRHVTTPTPPIHSTDRTSHSRNNPRATRNAIVGLSLTLD
jgi:hypothetical protein